MDYEHDSTLSADSALPSPAAIAAHSLFHEVWACGSCGRLFEDCTSCVAHEMQCGGDFSRQ